MMSSFFRWWNTNDEGIEYMTMLGCSINDIWIVSIVGVLCFFIVIQYSDVAYHNWSISRRYPDSNTKRYLLYFTGVFVFCLASGYLTRIISIWWNSYKFLAFLLLILNFMTWRFRLYMKRTRAVENLYKAESELSKKWKTLFNKMERRTLEGFASEEVTMITYKDLKSLEEGKKYPVNEGIYFMPLDLSGDVLMFKTIAKKGYSFGWQEHDCWEKCVLRKGELMDKVGGGVYDKDNPLIIPPNGAHNPFCVSKEDADLLVYFSKTKFK